MHRLTKTVKLFVILPILLCSFVIPLLRGTAAHAAPASPTLAYKDYATISVKFEGTFTDTKNRTFPVNINTDFVDKGAWDNTFQYTYKNGGCTSKIDMGSSGATTADIELNVEDPLDTGQCIFVDYKAVSIGNPAGAVFANWTSSSVITTVLKSVDLAEEGSGSTFSAQNKLNIYNLDCDALHACDMKYTRFTLTVSSDNKTGDLSILSILDVTAAGDKSKSVTIKGIKLGGSPDGPVTPPSQGGTTGGETTDPGPCGTGSGSWLCQLVTNNVAVQYIDNAINSALKVDVTDIFCTKGSTDAVCADQTGKHANSYKTAWQAFRNIAVILLLIGGLVMVSSQALGFEFLDAYTVRKVLPRLLIAIIGISLSWYVLAFIASFFNDFGAAVRSLIYHPFVGLTADIGGADTFSLANLGGAGILALGGFAVLGALGVASLFVTAFLALAVGLLVLAIRQIVIVMLIITAPIAIATYILPNTERIWKLWKDSFLGAMLMFPIISAFIAAGHAFAIVTFSKGNAGSTDGSIINLLIGFIAFFAPYFLLPITFRLATGAVGSIAGMVNDRGRGAFDRLKKYRGAKSAENVAGMKAGTRFNNGVLNAATSRATTRGFGVVGARGRAAYSQKLDLAAAEHAKSAGGMAIQHHDDALRAATYSSEVQARHDLRQRGWEAARINEAIGAVKASGGFGAARQVWAAQQMAATGTAYDDIQDVAQTIARASHGNAGQAAGLAGNINSATKQAQRFDLAPGFNNLNNLVQGEMAGGANRPQQHQYQDAAVAAAQGIDAVTLLRGKPAQVESLAAGLARRHAETGGTDQQINGQVADLLGSLQYASPDAQARINNHLGGLGIAPRIQGNQQQPGGPIPPGGPQPQP